MLDRTNRAGNVELDAGNLLLAIQERGANTNYAFAIARTKYVVEQRIVVKKVFVAGLPGLRGSRWFALEPEIA